MYKSYYLPKRLAHVLLIYLHPMRFIIMLEIWLIMGYYKMLKDEEKCSL